MVSPGVSVPAAEETVQGMVPGKDSCGSCMRTVDDSYGSVGIFHFEGEKGPTEAGTYVFRYHTVRNEMWVAVQ